MTTPHDVWVAEQNAAITEFARTIIPVDIQAEAAEGDYLAQEIVAGDVAQIARYEAMTEAELDAEISQLRATDGWNHAEGKFEVGEVDYAYHLIGVIESLREFRADAAGEARWTVALNAGPLTHRPFEALVAVA